MGRSYLIDHCVRYHKEKLDNRNFRISVAENIRGIFGYLTGKWEEIPSYEETLRVEKASKKEERSASDIIAGIKKKLSGDK